MLLRSGKNNNRWAWHIFVSMGTMDENGLLGMPDTGAELKEVADATETQQIAVVGGHYQW